MNKHEAKRLSETVTLEDLKSMFRNAQEKITDWTRVSRVNKGATIGTTYNILAFSPNHYASVPEIGGPGLVNMIWEFGEYLPGYEKPVAKTRAGNATVVHHEPKFKL
jgi:hypothetical protein